MNLSSGNHGDKPSQNLRTTRLFADGADLKAILALAANPNIKGFTTNPTLMRQAGVEDYVKFAHELLRHVTDRPISFEVFSDDFAEMEEQALEIASWGSNVNVKIPISDTSGAYSGAVIRRLSRAGVPLNITAIMTVEQVQSVVHDLEGDGHAFISVFAGRIADTGRDPVPILAASLERLLPRPRTELIWASPRELFNVFQADAIGCHVITATPSILAKLDVVGKDLMEYSLDTVRMFHKDAEAAGYKIAVASGKNAS